MAEYLVVIEKHSPSGRTVEGYAGPFYSYENAEKFERAFNSKSKDRKIHYHAYPPFNTFNKTQLFTPSWGTTSVDGVDYSIDPEVTLKKELLESIALIEKNLEILKTKIESF